MSNSLAMAYAMKRRKKTGEMSDMESGPKPSMPGEDVVDKVMRKKYSEGGKVANDGDETTSDLADSDSANFDDLALRDDLEGTNSGASDGDSLGNAQEDEDRHDIVSRIMKQRSMKQRNPRPA